MPAEDHADPAAQESTALYVGDGGTLPLEARRALVQLLSGPSLDGRRHSRLWPALIQHRAVIESRLADLFLELVLDSDLQTAFVRQADTGELDTPILLRRTPLTFLESVLLLYLRGLLADAELRGERAVVERDEMMEHMALYEPHLNTDHAGFEKRARAAIEKVKKNSLLSAIRGSEGRFEVSPTLKLLFSAEQVAQLARTYQALLGDEGGEGA
ncbi:MAG TPA: DUF4194 domain-containing protein [Gammaproteobacteria bacterium]|nr:DUF4194 domain-containing protein [Gammaproteobacteria bacterium]